MMKTFVFTVAVNPVIKLAIRRQLPAFVVSFACMNMHSNHLPGKAIWEFESGQTKRQEIDQKSGIVREKILSVRINFAFSV